MISVIGFCFAGAGKLEVTDPHLARLRPAVVGGAQAEERSFAGVKVMKTPRHARARDVTPPRRLQD